MNKFSVNDCVVYGKSGLCKIIEIKKILVAGKRDEYYILNSINENQVTIYVPCNNITLVSKMRYPMTAEQINNILLEAKGQHLPWIENRIERANYFNSITESENYRDWLLLVGCINLKKQEKRKNVKPLSSNDEKTLNLLEKLIEDEFCYSLNIEHSKIGEYIRQKLGIE